MSSSRSVAASKSGVKESGMDEPRRAVVLTGNAEAVLASRYLRKDSSGKCAETAADLFLRVATVVAAAEELYGMSPGAIETVRDEFYSMIASGKFMPNSPTLMNAGRPLGMLSACFVLPVEDSIDGIFTSVKNTAMIQKAGGGTGYSFSRLRPKGDLVSSSGGTTSGPLSFMKVFSEATNAIQQGAFRRGANMGMMRIDHPDIIDFINVKEDLTQLTNFNLSVSMTDDFMNRLRECPDTEHVVYNPRTSAASALAKPDGSGNWTVGELFSQIVAKAWQSGEPGIVFIDHMNAANPTPHVGEIECTNPCGEQPLLPYESCNLGSINLRHFLVDDGNETSFDSDGFVKTVRLAVRFLDDVIDVNHYPLPEIEEMTKANRKVGLGLMGFSDALYALGIAYDSESGLEFGETLMQTMNEESHRVSEELAESRGCFPNWKGSVWDERGVKMRNACTTTLAPTGTVSIIANCSCGIEPVFSLVFERNVLDGQRLLEVNEVFEQAAREHGFYSDELMDHIATTGSVQDLEQIPDEIKRVFVTAGDITPDWHIRMQAAFQKHCDSSISKTVNFPNSASVDDVRDIFLKAHEYQCKGVTVYRDGCRLNQPMSLRNEGEEGTEEAAETSSIALSKAFARPVTLPDIMPAVSVKQITPFGNMHVKIVVDPESERELEVFAQLGKGGDIACSDLEAMCRLMSLYLRVNGSLDDIVGQLADIGSSLTIPTKDGRIASLADALSKAIRKYQEAKKIDGLESLLLGRSDLTRVQQGLRGLTPQQSTAPRAEDAFKLKCPDCLSTLVMAEGCIKCLACGYSQCS